ncbi:Fanconi anemia core complex-associated protein 20 isoform X1 [Delphinus delphis]|uniref:Fanconi anemia core complex-associated protein 20 isoform X1 n=1 Tax=Delphinus delphis TaxID=9728 RepID=UPI0028C4D756|nr:Fanconi anemia core complex-associated protein 20 isoform X1 [Delphinus delphis]
MDAHPSAAVTRVPEEAKGALTPTPLTGLARPAHRGVEASAPVSQRQTPLRWGGGQSTVTLALRTPGAHRSPSKPPGSPPDGGECARPWAELLRAACAELNVDGEPPPLPAFPGQEPTRSPERAPPESFIVGTETFSWTPFPPAPRRGGDPSDCDRVLREALGRTGSSAWSPQRHPAPEPRGTSSAEEQPSVEGLPTLQSCPMCQAVFAPRLTQLDIESHLAQCLAESTDDVVW